jgi:hypothetical protein
MNWLHRWMTRPEPPEKKEPPLAALSEPVLQPAPDESLPAAANPAPAGANVRTEAEAYLHRVQEKINRLAEEFSQGIVNRAQFIRLYEHYQKERQSIEHVLAVSPENWRAAASEGQSIAIRREHYAQPLGFSIYENASGMPLTTLGKFDLDPALMVPMLSSYREAAREMFGSRIRSTAIENGRWLCFVAGQLTTLIALYNTEPAARQLQFLEETHQLFERANKPRLTQVPMNIEGLVFPHEVYLH